MVGSLKMWGKKVKRKNNEKTKNKIKNKFKFDKLLYFTLKSFHLFLTLYIKLHNLKMHNFLINFNYFYHFHNIIKNEKINFL